MPPPDLPRDGGMADLLREAAAPAPKFAAVVCEDIERSGRDMFNALKLEKELSRQGIPLFATDEPADIEGVNATTVLVRRVKQGVAEWYRLQLKEKIWKGLVEHSLDGWNIGTPAYGFAAERIAHPVPFKAAQGRTKSRLILDPVRAPVIAQMYAWRTVDKLGCPAIAVRLNADPASYPPPNPATGSTAQNVRVMLANPKYTGRMVYGRHRTRNGRRAPSPRTSGSGHRPRSTLRSWTGPPGTPPSRPPPPTAPAATATTPTPTPPPAGPTPTGPGSAAGTAAPDDRHHLRQPRRDDHLLPVPAQPRHPQARRRPSGPPAHRPGPRGPARPHHRDVLRHPDLGPGRAALRPRSSRPPTPTPPQRAMPRRPGSRPGTGGSRPRQNSQILELEDLPADPADTAAAAMRARIRARFADLHHEREQLETQLAALAKTTPAATDPALLRRTPAPGRHPARPAPALKARLLAAFGIEILWNKPGQQVTVFAEITENTLQAIPSLTDPGQDGSTTQPSDQRRRPRRRGASERRP